MTAAFGRRLMPPGVRSLRHGAYRLFAAGALVGGSANWAVRFIQLLLVLRVSGQAPWAAGLVAALQYGPVLVLGPVLGRIADRRERTDVLAASQAAMGVAVLLQAGALVSGADGMWSCLVFAALFGMTAAADNTVRLAVVPDLVPEADLVGAVSLNVVSIQVGRLVGPAVAGFALAMSSTAAVLGVAALALLAFGGVLTLLGRRRATRRGDDAVLDSPVTTTTGVAWIRSEVRVRTVFVVVAAAGLLGPNLTTIATVTVARSFDGGAVASSVVVTGLAFGTVVGAFSTTLSSRAGPRGVVTGAVVLAGFVAASALAPSLPLYTVMVASAGAAGLVMVSQAGAWLQTVVPCDVRGRVTAVFAAVLVAGVPVGAPLFGLVAAVLGPRAAAANLAGAVVLVMVASCLTARGRRPGQDATRG